MENCFGFVDGTVRPISPPVARLVYNGHKRVHALKFQTVALPNGLVGNLYGPVGKCNHNYYLVLTREFQLVFRKPEIPVVVVAVVMTIL